MAEILVLCTKLETDYWKTHNKAPYDRKFIEKVKHLEKMKPLAGIGAYVKQLASQPPCFITITDIREEEKQLALDFDFIAEIPGLTSSELLGELVIRNYLSPVPQEKILNVLKKLNVQPPSKWLELQKVRPTFSWQDWIGRRFQELHSIANEEYENRIAELFNAFGFNVKQEGHLKGAVECPDGVIYLKDFAIIYDCKNKSNCLLDADDKRKMAKYVRDYRRIIEEKERIEEIYFAFIAHSYYSTENVLSVEEYIHSKGFFFTSEDMLYLLYKKLRLGSDFLLARFRDLPAGRVITIEDLDKIYGAE